ncbi:hypothetical protein HMPREF1583_01159, partial [Gardnerella vaginalis JCP8151B]
MWHVCATYFPHFVRDLGQIWYKVRQLVPLFVRDLGQIWYKTRHIARATTNDETDYKANRAKDCAPSLSA